MSGSPQPTPTIVIAGLPPKTLVGIDLYSFTSAPNFHGVKDLPPGAHFLYTGTTESYSLRSGEWFYVGDTNDSERSGQLIKQGQIDIRLRKWDEALESVEAIDESTDVGRQEAMQLRANLGRIWASGGFLAYQSRLGAASGRASTSEGDDAYEHTPSRGDWQKLASYITPSLLNRVLGPNVQRNTTEHRWTITSGSSAPRDTDYIPGLSITEVANATGVAGEQEKELRFLPIDLKKTWREGAVGRERTEAAQDRSWALGDLITHAALSGQSDMGDVDTAGESQVLGELQFTFLVVLTLMNFSSLEQWKRLLGLILTCKAAIKEREGFFVKVIHLLRLQLSHCDDVEGGLFEMGGDDGGIILRNLLIKFKKSLDEIDPSGNTTVYKEFARLESWVKSEYDWELFRGSIVRRGMVELEDGEQVELEMKGTEEEDETGEYAPVVVDIGEEGPQEPLDTTMSMSDRPS